MAGYGKGYGVWGMGKVTKGLIPTRRIEVPGHNINTHKIYGSFGAIPSLGSDKRRSHTRLRSVST